MAFAAWHDPVQIQAVQGYRVLKDPDRCAGDDSDQLPLAGEVRVRVRPESPGSQPLRATVAS